MKEEIRKKRSKEMQGNKIAEKWTEEKALELGNELIEWLKQSSEKNVFFIKFLAPKGISHQLVSELANKFKSFQTLLDIAKDIQEGKILENGILGGYNATITKFVLINHFGYQDKKVIEDNSEKPILHIDLGK